MNNKNILISGAGIAGETLAYWLTRYGFKVTIVESAPNIREGGYSIDFFGAGYTVAEKMGIIKEIQQHDIIVDELSFISDMGERYGGLDLVQLRAILKGRFHSIHRSDLAHIIHDSLPRSSVRYIFGNSIEEIVEISNGVHITFKNGDREIFDLLIGADGLHSHVRKLIFGEEREFEHFMGYYVSSYTTDNFLSIDENGLSYTVPGKQILIYPIPGDKLTVVYILKAKDRLYYDRHDRSEQEKIILDAFDGIGWRSDELLERLPISTDFYFDAVSQIKMHRWTHGRVTLLGDACACPSLLSGQGSTLAMVGAYILAGELSDAGGDYSIAFRQYEQAFLPFIQLKQKNAENLSSSFVPGSKFGVWLRDRISSYLFSGWIPKVLIMNYLTDSRLQIREYQNPNT